MSATTTTTTTTNIASNATLAAAYDRIEASYAYRADNKIDPALKRQIAVALGYDEDYLIKIPDDANIGEGCGNPLLIAALEEGETVVDLGSGGGYDALLASHSVGPTGKVIGIDMTEKMISLGRKNAARAKADNVSFVYSKIHDTPIESSTIDCVMSNCVFNLVPEADKPDVIKEIHRMLRPGGRVAISDFLALKPLPADMKNDPELLAGCVGGAMEVDALERLLMETGFDDVLLVDTKKDLNMYKNGEESKSVTPCCAAGASCGPGITPSGRKELDYDLNEWISSFEIFAHKSCGKTRGPKRTIVMRASSEAEGSDADASLPPQKACSGNKGCC